MQHDGFLNYITIALFLDACSPHLSYEENLVGVGCDSFVIGTHICLLGMICIIWQKVKRVYLCYMLDKAHCIPDYHSIHFHCCADDTQL